MTFQPTRYFDSDLGMIYLKPTIFRPLSWLFVRSAAAVLLLGMLAQLAAAQAYATAERQLNVQIGGMLSLANPGIPKGASVLYGPWTYGGGGVYATLDSHRRFGLELGARQVVGSFINEQTYSGGPRYYKPYGRYVPYGKILIGRGTFRFPENIGALSFTTVSIGGGLDYRFSSVVHLRGDYEYQRWLGFSDKVQNFPGALTPQIISIGVAYHIR